jgi:hypothetical protein
MLVQDAEEPMGAGTGGLDIEIVEQAVMEAGGRSRRGDGIGKGQPLAGLTDEGRIGAGIPGAGRIIFLGEVDEYRLGIAQDEAVVVDDRKLAQRIEAQKPGRFVLAAGIEIDRDRFIRQAEDAHQQSQFVAVAGELEVIELDHDCSPFTGPARDARSGRG